MSIAPGDWSVAKHRLFEKASQHDLFAQILEMMGELDPSHYQAVLDYLSSLPGKEAVHHKTVDLLDPTSNM